MDINIVREIVTVVSFLVFVGIMVWAASASNRRRFEEAAMLPFEEDDLPRGNRGNDGQGSKS